MKKVLVKHYTADELKALADFFGSDVGQSVMAKSAAYWADVSPIVEGIITEATAAFSQYLRVPVENPPPSSDRRGAGGTAGKVYAGVRDSHWISENIDRGSFILLEDGALWQVDPLERLDASLWLHISSITVIEADEGSLGYDYLLINTDDGEKAHANCIVDESLTRSILQTA